MEDDLLTEVTNLVEAPTALLGNFNPAFLKLPREVLISVMQKQQRYFPLQKDGSLLPNFVTVRNGDDQYLELVQQGNEHVLGARFADADFFVREDGRWRMDIAAEVRNTREFSGGRFNWGYVGATDAYSRAFADLLVNLRGVRRFRDGDNREIPVRGLQGL